MQPLSLGPRPLGPQTPLSAPPGAVLKRPFQLDTIYPPGREIRPKPSVPSGPVAQPEAVEPPPKRKRGRPPKTAGVQVPRAASGAIARDEPSSSVIQVSPPCVVAPGSLAAAPIAEENRPTLPPLARMPIADILTPAPPKSGGSSSSSSGKRRRGRSMRLEQEQIGTIERPDLTAQQPYESPYARPASALEDTPARAAVLRHREEHPPPPPQFQRPGGP